MQIAKPGFAAVDLATCVYLDIEATGLEPEDEVVAIGIVDAAGAVRLDTLVRPQRKKTWPRTQRIHGISPAAVATAPAWPELAPAIRAAVRGCHVVAYGADFDGRFVGDLLEPGAEIHCCRQAWARHVGQWSPYAGPPRRYRWHKLVDAAADVEFDWERAGGGPHTPIPAAQACRAVWIFLQDRLLWACIWGSRELVQEFCQMLEHLAYLRQQQRDLFISLCWTRFVDHWWLGLYGRAHWTTRSADPGAELAAVFTGTTLRGSHWSR